MLRRLRTLADKLSTHRLPRIPYVLPEDKVAFAPEHAGSFSRDWLAKLPAYQKLIRNSVYADSRQALWSASHGDSHDSITNQMNYDALAHHIMEHSFFFLLPKLLVAEDAPLPHVVYEDMLKCKTFSSLQLPPEEQFALEPQLLRAVLCLAAQSLLTDPHYFGTCEHLFRTMEQQQSIDTRALSAFIFCCTAAGQVREAAKYAKLLAHQDEAMDPLVFSLMMHPSSSPKEHDVGAQGGGVLTDSAKGFLLQRRLQNRLSSVYKADSVAFHSMFVFYSLTLNHYKKWETIRVAIEEGVELCGRTVRFAVEVYKQEKGQRCGPKTHRCLLHAVAKNGSVGDLLYVLLRSRMNELLPQTEDVLLLEHSSEFTEMVVEAVRVRANGGEEGKLFAVALPVVEALLRVSNREQLHQAMRSIEGLQFPTMKKRDAVGPTSQLPTTFQNRHVAPVPALDTQDLPTQLPGVGNNSKNVPHQDQRLATTPTVDSFLQLLSSITRLEEQHTPLPEQQLRRRKKSRRNTKNTTTVSLDEAMRIGSKIEGKKIIRAIHDATEESNFRRATSELEKELLFQHEVDWRSAWTSTP